MWGRAWATLPTARMASGDTPPSGASDSRLASHAQPAATKVRVSAQHLGARDAFTPSLGRVLPQAAAGLLQHSQQAVVMTCLLLARKSCSGHPQESKCLYTFSGGAHLA